MDRLGEIPIHLWLIDSEIRMAACRPPYEEIKKTGQKNEPNDTKDLRARMGGLWGREGVHPGRGPNGNSLAIAKSRSHSSGI